MSQQAWPPTKRHEFVGFGQAMARIDGYEGSSGGLHNMEISFEQRVIAPVDVMFRDLDGEAVLLNLDNESYYGLDDVGTRIWQVLTSSDSIEDAVIALVREYEVEEAQLRADVMELVNELVQDGLVRVEDASLA